MEEKKENSQTPASSPASPPKNITQDEYNPEEGENDYHKRKQKR